MASKTTKPSLQDIEASLPTCPDKFHYEVERVSPLVTRVWLCHHRQYLYKKDPVRTIYCFIKGNKVYPPRNTKTARPKSVGLLIDMSSMSWHTTIVPTGPRDLTHL